MRSTLALPALALAGLALLASPVTAHAQSVAGSSVSSFAGDLDDADGVDGAGRHSETRTVQLGAGEEVEIAASSDAFDTVLRVQGPSGLSEENDDADGEGTNSRLRFRAPRNGSYRLTVTSYRAGETGHYEITMSRRGAGAVNPGIANARPGCANGSCPYPGATAAPMVPTQPQQPVYAPGGYPTPGQFGWVFDPSVGQFVPVQPPANGAMPQMAAPNAAPGMNPGAAMMPGAIVPLPPNSVAAVDPNGTTDDGSVDDGNDGNDGSNAPAYPNGNSASPNGTVYGVFVGISDYGGSNNLEYTADDARRLAGAFQRTGIIRQGNAIVLTDGEATPQRVSHAIRTIGQRVTERDTFVFFFDGHGSANQISLRQGSMDEGALSALLDGVRGRQLVVLDSCHAGSLSGVVQGRANRTGLFSSRAEESSYVADELRAGGYLAHAMIEAVETGADSNGDGMVQLSELAGHARQVYQQHVHGRQNLVVASGAGRAASLWRSAGGATAVAMR